MVSSHILLHDIIPILWHVFISTGTSEAGLQFRFPSFLFLCINSSLMCSNSHIVDLVLCDAVMIVERCNVKLFCLEQIEIRDNACTCLWLGTSN
jgi:hypothetical protein